MVSNAFDVRPAARHEIPAIEALTVAAYAQYRAHAPANVFEAYVADLRQLAQHWDEADVLVVEHAGRIAGSVMFYADASSEGLGLPLGWAGFRKLAVHPQMRGRHLGEKLVASCMDRGRQLGAPAIGIHTASFMTAAHRIYERMGFERCPQYDLNAAHFVGAEGGADAIVVMAYRADLARSHGPAR